MHRRVLSLLAILGLMTALTPLRAETLRGSNYIGTSFGSVKFGNDLMDDALGLGYGLSGLANIPLSGRVDLSIGVGAIWSDGDLDGVDFHLRGVGAGTDLIYSLRPGTKINPYISAGISAVRDTLRISILGEKRDYVDSDVGGGGAVGLEVDVAPPMLLRLGAGYQYIDGGDSVNVGGLLGYGFSKNLMGTLGGGYNFNSENRTARIGLILKM